jgi:hypothetical protein
MDDSRIHRTGYDESAGALDAFSEEHPTPRAPESPLDAPSEGDALIRIVIADDQLGTLWDEFAVESSDSKQHEEPGSAGRDISATALKPIQEVRVRPAGRRAPAVAAFSLAIVVLALIGRTLMTPPDTSRRAVTTVAPALPAVASNTSPARSDAASVRRSDRVDATVTPLRSETDSTPNRVPARAVDVRPAGQRAADTRSPAQAVPVHPLLEVGVPAPLQAATPVEDNSPAAIPSPAAPSSARPVVGAASVADATRGPEATPPAAAAAPTPISAPPAPSPSTQVPAVTLVLNGYQQAFSALDANAAQVVWPAVDVKALSRAFDQLEEQTFDLQKCEIGVSGSRAEASCSGTASYVRKVGRKAVRLEPRRWQFTLRQENGYWVIDTVQVR